MALISCPECGKEISDKAEKCIYCGKVFEERIVDPPKLICSECGVELEAGMTICDKCGCPIQSEDEKEKEIENKTKEICKRRNVKIVGVIALAMVGIILGLNFNKSYQAKKAYNECVDILHLASETMLEGSSRAEDLTDLTARVWSNAIYEEKDVTTDEYVCPGGEFVDDFNTALTLLYWDESTSSKVEEISNNQETVKDYMKKIQNVPDGFEKCYETITDLYDAYVVITDLAINPTGNYNSFTESARTALSDFTTAYKKLESQIPEKR